MNLKNPGLDLIRRIHSKSGFSGFMIRFWILVIKRRIRSRIQESGLICISQKKRTLNLLPIIVFKNFRKFKGNMLIISQLLNRPHDFGQKLTRNTARDNFPICELTFARQYEIHIFEFLQFGVIRGGGGRATSHTFS